MELALAYALRPEGKTDQEKFKSLEWGLRTWDHPTTLSWTQVSALYGMAGGGVVPDVCLVFERKCRAFDLAPSDSRPEIEYHHWNPQKGTWPLEKKPDLQRPWLF